MNVLFTIFIFLDLLKTNLHILKILIKQGIATMQRETLHDEQYVTYKNKSYKITTCVELKNAAKFICTEEEFKSQFNTFNHDAMDKAIHFIKDIAKLAAKFKKGKKEILSFYFIIL